MLIIFSYPSKDCDKFLSLNGLKKVTAILVQEPIFNLLRTDVYFGT